MNPIVQTDDCTQMSFEGKHSTLTGQILGAFFNVYNRLRYGFSEKVYENALALELESFGLSVEQQKPIQVYYEGEVVGEYYADILVNNLVILELKAARKILDEHTAKLLSYLKSTQIEVGLLLNFGPKPQHVRKVYDNDQKGSMSWLRV